MQQLLYACWYVIDNKRGATGVTVDRSGFSEFKKYIFWGGEKIAVSSLTKLVNILSKEKYTILT